MNIPVDKRLGMLKTSAVAAACLTLMSFLVACGGGAGSANSSSWEKAITPPKLTGISPASGPTTGGTTVAITGTDFQKGATVVFGNVPAAKINSVTSTSIEAVTPVHDPGIVDVKVTNPDTRSDTLLVAFTFEGAAPPRGGPPPTISSALPNSGPVVGGTVVTITGTDFQSGATVTFGQSPATAVVFNSATQLQATTPAHAPGTVNVIVRNPDTQSATVSGGFTYQPVPAPTIISLLPTSGPEVGGTLVTIWGTNFLAGATVSFGGVAAASVTVTSATQLGAVTPPHAAGVVDVRVTNLDDQFATLVGAFTYGTPPPAIISISPSSGTIAGDTSVTITGTGFQPGVPGTTVTFGSVAASGVNVISSTQIHAMTPAHDAGSVDVRVANPDTQSATRVGGYVYVSGTAPTISSLSVDSGLSSGGTPVTITGSDFAGDATVTFGTLPAASVTVVSPTRIDVTTPSQAAGTIVDVTVTNPDTLQGTLPNAFRYGRIIFQTGFETGNFNEWSSVYDPHSVMAITNTAGQVYSGNYAGSIRFALCGVQTPPAATLGSTGSSSFGTRTYYVTYTYMSPNNLNDESGHETPQSVEQSVAVGANQLFNMTTPPAQVAIDRYMVYVGTVSGTRYLQTTTPATVGANWTEPASCPGGHTCISGTSIMNGTITTPTTSDACPGPGVFSSGGGYWQFLQPSPGQTHFFVRGFFKVHKNDPAASDGDGYSKMMFWKDPTMAWSGVWGLGRAPSWDFNFQIQGAAEGFSLETSSSYGPAACGLLGAICTRVEYHFTYDVWYYVELEVLGNTPGTPIIRDGALRLWVQQLTVSPPTSFYPAGRNSDPAPLLIMEATNLNLNGGLSTTITQFEFGRQYSRRDYHAVDETRYWDNIVIGDAYIGSEVPPP
jgi:hypothetical protein